jgi:hypothetical protein
MNGAAPGAPFEKRGTTSGVCKASRAADPSPLKWSDLRYVFDIKGDCNGKEAVQARKIMAKLRQVARRWTS